MPTMGVHRSLRAPRRRPFQVGAVAALAVVVAACGSSSSSSSSPPTTAAASTATTAATSKAGAGTTACLMVSSLGIDDHGFNQEAWDALQLAQKNLGVTIKYLAESGSISYSTIGSQFVSEGCTFIVGEGFDTASAIQSLATANPNVKFALIDDTLTTPTPNAVSLVFKTQQAAFLGGYLAAGSSKAKMIGMFGNEPIPPVEDYLNGFYAGIQYYNQVNKTTVKAIGWDPSSKTGEFMGSFTDTNKAQTITQQELQQGADIVYGVGLPNSVAAAVQQQGGPGNGTSMVWVDEDGCAPYPQYCNVQLTSVEKNITPTVYSVLQTAVKGTFAGGEYDGTLSNNGVGLAPYHDFASKIPTSLQSQVTALKAKVVSGAVNPDPYSG